MKLWRRRPLSVDLTPAEEMPPSVVYISPGVHAVSKRSSLVNNEITSKTPYFSEVTSFNFVEKSTATNKDESPLQSFRDYNNSRVSFEDSTLRSSRLSNKTYLTPISAEWLPVKDVMKIKRSASVPFQSKQTPAIQQQSTVETSKTNVKTHTSLAQKLRTLFRTRSNSRSSKTVLTPITESKSNKVCLRNSRARTKDVEGCKSMYESSRIHDGEFSERLNHVLKDCGKRSLGVTIVDNAQSMDEKAQPLHQVNKKDKSISEFQKRVKECQVSRDQQKFINSKGFSESVFSHTASSAAKVQKNKTNYHQNEKPIDKRCISRPSSSKYEFPLSREISQPITTQNNDKKNIDLHKSDSPNKKANKMDGKKMVQRREGSKPNQSLPPSGHYTGDKFHNLESISNQKPEEDDYVRLAEIDLSLVPSNSFMAQSLHGAIISELANSNHEYENIDLRDFKANVNHQHHTAHAKYTNYPQDIFEKPPDGQQKRRPISCIAVVDSDNCKLLHKKERYFTKESPKHNFPKSPYLSQYTKLYSLKATDGKILYTQQSEPLDCDIMTRSQTSCPYRSPPIMGKESSGKISIDSGLVDDLSMNYRNDSIIKT